MIITKMTEEERPKILAYLLPYEKFSVNLYSEVLRKSPAIYVIRGNFGEIHGVFSWWQGSALHHCIPDVYSCNRIEMESAFIKFFDEMAVKYLFSIAGEKAGCQLIKKVLDEHFYKLVFKEVDYWLMENGRFDSKTNLVKMNRQLSVAVCKEEECDRVFPLQAEFEKEEVLIEDSVFDEESSRAKFENFVEAGAVYTGTIKNVPLCKATVNAMGTNYALLGGVYTIPQYRNHGLARALVYNVCEAMKNQYKKCVLFVKTANTGAVRVYEDCGFKKLCDFQILYYRPRKGE